MTADTLPAPSHAERLRTLVVMTVLIGVLLLAAGLYSLIGFIVIRHGTDAVPDALWLAAGTYGGALVTWLVNSSHNTDASPTGSPADPVNVKTAVEPLEVTPADVRPDVPAESDL